MLYLILSSPYHNYSSPEGIYTSFEKASNAVLKYFESGTENEYCDIWLIYMNGKGHQRIGTWHNEMKSSRTGPPIYQLRWRSDKAMSIDEHIINEPKLPNEEFVEALLNQDPIALDAINDVLMGNDPLCYPISSIKNQ